MKKIAAVIVATVSLFIACQGHASGADGHNEAGFSDMTGSRIPLDLTFYDEGGREVRLGEIIDRPTVLTLVYFNCSHICPQMLEGLAVTLDALPLTPGRDYRVITLSFDDRDNPAGAREAKNNYTAAIGRPFPPEAWRFLTGDSGNIDKVAGSVGISVKREDHGFVHPEVLIFLSLEGRITKYMNVLKYNYGLAYPVAFSTMDMERSIGEAAVNKVSAAQVDTPLYCFLHEPPGQRKLFGLMKILGVMTLILLAVLYVVLRTAGRSARTGDGGKSGK